MLKISLAHLAHQAQDPPILIVKSVQPEQANSSLSMHSLSRSRGRMCNSYLVFQHTQRTSFLQYMLS